MIIVGELINASRKKISEAIKSGDADFISAIAAEQKEKGADYIDVNAGTFVDDEAEKLCWLVETVQSKVDAPCCIDSPDPKAIEQALKVHQGTAMVNSISLEKERYEAMLPLIAGTDLKIVALCMSDDGMPQTCDERMAVADKLVNSLVANNVPLENIYVDPLVQPVSTNDNYGKEFLAAISGIMAKFPGVHTCCGLSNISFGLPTRKMINQTFMVMAINSGLDAAIIDPLDARMMAAIVTAEMISGRDEYCGEYIQCYRDKKFEF
jgi:cobalamin-dependent methionine synthase I